MARKTRALLFLALAASVSPACLFTDDINQPPTIDRPRAGSPVIVREQPVRFTAAASDPDQAADTLEMRWTLHPGGCTRAVGSSAGRPGTLGSFFDLTRTELGPICVRVTVFDDDGATASSEETFTVQNQKPQAKLELRVTRGEPEPAADGRYDLYSSFRASWTGSSDPDRDDQTKLQPLWQLTDARGQVFTPKPCPSMPRDVCFDADVPGDYALALLVLDPHQEKDETTRKVQIAPDRPPCVLLTTPPFSVAGHKLPSHKPSVFDVAQVKDDGDPWPAQSRPGAFAWSWRTSQAQKWDRLGGNVQSGTLNFGADYFRPGDVVQVRVQYRDRLDVDGGREYGACARDDKADCELEPGSLCWQWVSWTVEYY